MIAAFTNPFQPGAGHKPPYLAGRVAETEEFRRLLRQDVVPPPPRPPGRRPPRPRPPR